MNDRERIDCEEALRRLAEYVDRELGEKEEAEVERHLDMCRSCFSRAEFERRLKERIRSDLNVGSAPSAFTERMRALIRELPTEP